MKRLLSLALIALVGWCAACSYFRATPGLPVHLVENVEAQPVRPVDSRPTKAVAGTTRVEQLASLETTVAEGFRPTFDGIDERVRQTYEAAIEILNRYIGNGFDDYARVHTVHDYLTSRVDYDADLYRAYLTSGTVTNEHASFHLDGVFLDGVAVCDGFAKAFMFLCNLEGIPCARIVGDYAGMAHVWNKVRVGERWYNVDVTLDKAYYTASGATAWVAHHGFFLISDANITAANYGRHSFAKGWNPSDEYAPRDYGYYTGASVDVGGQTYTAVITEPSQLAELFRAVGKSKRQVGKLEVRLALEGYNPDATVAFDSCIRDAYAQVKSDFAFDPEHGSVPYLRYPNGAFVFLIYI